MLYTAKPIIEDEEKDAVLEVLNSGMIAQGKKVELLENQFSNFIGTNFTVATSNGTTALHLALLASGIGEGDEVITTPFSFISTISSIIHAGATPVLVDIDENSFNIDPDLIESAITEKTKAILAVHLYGNPCDMDKISEIAKKHNLVLIEDACQAHGAMYKNRKIGSFGVGCFSLYATKNMTSGEGGLITTKDSKINNSLRLLRNHGQEERYRHKIIGFNYRMTDLQAAIALVQLGKIDDFNESRIENAKFLSDNISYKGIVTPKVEPNIKHVFHQYTIRVTDEYPLSRADLIKLFEKNGIQTSIFYPIPLYGQDALKEIFGNMSLPVVEKVCQEVLSLPIHPSVSMKDLKNIVNILNNPE
ncbi:MAG: DegT/DnrJ/EryC1/StrS family aminotransferase [Candidatus Woesearchaeota archaeon]